MERSKFRQKVRDWLNAEIADVMSCYSLTKEEAEENIRDLLCEDEYRDELTDSQANQAILFLDAK